MRTLALLLALFFAPLILHAQTVVSGTVADTSSYAYSGATMTITYAVGGVTRLVPPVFSLNSAGKFSANLTASSGGGTYTFTASFQGVAYPIGTGPQTCTVSGVTVSGSTQTVSFSSCPALTNISGSGSSAVYVNGVLVSNPDFTDNPYFTFGVDVSEVTITPQLSESGGQIAAINGNFMAPVFDQTGATDPNPPVGWLAPTGGTITYDTTSPPAPSGFWLKQDCTSTAPGDCILVPNTYFNVVQNEKYIASAWLKSDGTSPAAICISFTQGNKPSGDQEQCTHTLSTSAVFEVVTGTVPSGVDTGFVYFGSVPNSDGSGDPVAGNTWYQDVQAHSSNYSDLTASELVQTDANKNLSSSNVLPNGTTATTQSPGDNTTKAATDAFVLANSGSDPMTTLGDDTYGGAAGAFTRLAGPTAAGTYYKTEKPSSGAATAQTYSLAGVVPNPQTGTTYTYLQTDSTADRAGYTTFSNASAIAVTLPQAGSTGFGSNWVNKSCNIGAGTVTITPTTSTVSYTTGGAYVSAGSSVTLVTGQCIWLYSDNTNYFANREGGNATSTNCAGAGTAASPSVASCSAAPSGAFSCAPNASTATCVIDTTAVTANSNIFIQPTAAAGTRLSVTCNTSSDTGVTAPRLASISAGTSFTINLGTFSTNPECFDYWVVN